MRLDGKILNADSHGNVSEPNVVEVDGKKRTKMKPNPATFELTESTWVDVTAKAPRGAGAKMPMTPNPHFNKLDGPKLPTGEVHNGICTAGDAGGRGEEHFDLCVGREDHHITTPSAGSPGTICEIEILDLSNASKPGAT